MAEFDALSKSVIAGDMAAVVSATKAAIDAGSDPLEIINNGLIAGMNVVGAKFKAGDMFVPEVLMAAKSMAAGVDIVKPLIAEGSMAAKGKILIGTVKGDLHDIGKNLVAMMMESSGFDVVNVGVDIASDKFVAAVKEHKPDVVGLSALLTTTMPAMKDTIDALTEAGLRKNIKVIIGGAPVTSDFAKEIGADGFAPDAASAAELVGELCKK